MQRSVVLAILAAECLFVSAQNTKQDAPEKHDEDLKNKYEELRKAKQEVHLAEEAAKAQEAESKATVQDKEAKVEEAKADLKIEKATMQGNQKEVSAATTEKAKAQAEEKLDEAVIKTSREEEKAAQDEEIKVEQQFNETLTASGTQDATLITKPAGTKVTSWGGTLCLFLVLGVVIVVLSNTLRRQHLCSKPTDHPMMVGYQQGPDDGFTLRQEPMRLSGAGSQFHHIQEYSPMTESMF